MPGTPTTKYAIPTLAGSDLARDIDTLVNSSLTSIDSKMVGHSAGPLASRPVSTGGTPGIAGRLYGVTDQPGRVDRDNGTGWDILLSAPTLLGHWRTLAEARSLANGSSNFGLSSGLHFLCDGDWIIANGVTVATTEPLVPSVIPITAADLAVAGLTTKLRLRVALATNAASTAWTSIAFTFGLHPVSSYAGSGAAATPTLGAATSGSAIALTPTGNSQKLVGASGEFSLPADGQFMFGVNLGAGIAQVSRSALLFAALQVRHV